MKTQFLHKTFAKKALLSSMLLSVAGTVWAQSSPGQLRTAHAASAPAPANAGPSGAAAAVHYYNVVRLQDAMSQLMYDEILGALCPDLTKREHTDRRGMRKLNRTPNPIIRNQVRA